MRPAGATSVGEEEQAEGIWRILAVRSEPRPRPQAASILAQDGGRTRAKAAASRAEVDAYCS